MAMQHDSAHGIRLQQPPLDLGHWQVRVALSDIATLNGEAKRDYQDLREWCEALPEYTSVAVREMLTTVLCNLHRRVSQSERILTVLQSCERRYDRR